MWYVLLSIYLLIYLLIYLQPHRHYGDGRESQDRLSSTLVISAVSPWRNEVTQPSVNAITLCCAVATVLSQQSSLQLVYATWRREHISPQNNGLYAVQGRSRSAILVPIESSYTASYEWLISCTVSEIAFDRSKIAIFDYPLLCLTPPAGGVSLGRSPYNFMWMSKDGQGTKCRIKIAENY